MIPLTDKELLVQINKPLQIYTHTFSNTTRGNYTHSYTNPNVYAVIVLISAQAGSGDINNSWHQPSGGTQYYNAGRSGHNLTIKVNNTTLTTLYGGAGSQGGALRATRHWRGSSKRWSGWSAYNNSKQVAQNGQTTSMIVTLPPKATLQFIYTYQNASSSAHLGSHTISAFY